MKTSARRTALLLSLLLLAGTAAVSCGESTPGTDEKNTAPADTGTAADTEPTEAAYPYEIRDLDGFTMRVLNSGPLWEQFMTLDTKATTGEVLNDAVYNRNRKVESLLNCKIDVTEITANDSLNQIRDAVTETVLAGEDLYEIMYAPISTQPSMVTDGFFFNLLDIDGLHTDKEWWDVGFNSSVEIDGSLNFASGAMHLKNLEGTWALFFNESMMEKHDLDLPYELVRSGKWTVDTMLNYEKTVANLNGDESFTWSQNGNSVYGLSLHVTGARAFTMGCEEFYAERGKDGMPVYTAGDDRFYEAMDKLSQVLGNTSGIAIYGSDYDFNAEKGGYQYIFSVSRALFLTAEVKAAQQLRNMTDTFGVLPYPKLDEAQKDYVSYQTAGLCFTIPVTSTHVEETALVSDVLTWQSYTDVLPVYYGNVVEQKGLRNDDSIEMMHIIRDNAVVDLANVFGWTKDLQTMVRQELYKGNGAFSSNVEKYRSQAEDAIQKTINALRTAKENG